MKKSKLNRNWDNWTASCDEPRGVLREVLMLRLWYKLDGVALQWTTGPRKIPHKFLGKHLHWHLTEVTSVCQVHQSTHTLMRYWIFDLKHLPWPCEPALTCASGGNFVKTLRQCIACKPFLVIEMTLNPSIKIVLGRSQWRVIVAWPDQLANSDDWKSVTEIQSLMF